MPRLSLWRPSKTNDYKFLDNTIREQFTVGGLDVYIHAYLGHTDASGNDVPVNPPADEVTTPVPIEDLLFLENRNRNYDEDVKIIRGVYNVQDLEFDLSQFGLFVAGDTLYMQVHYNDMIDILGRKFLSGDVVEIPNLRDYNPLNQLIPAALPKFYVVEEGSFAAQGFSQTWQPHLWRLKLTPMKGSQEYKDILDNCLNTEGDIDGDDGTCNESCTLGEWLCEHNKNILINDANTDEAENEVPKSGYDNDMYFMLGPDGEYSKTGYGYEVLTVTFDDESTIFDNDETTWKEYELNEKEATMRNGNEENAFLDGYLTGDARPPNGAPLTTAVTFPPEPEKSDYVLRVDYKPEQLFQYTGSMWKAIEAVERTGMYLGTKAQTQRNRFVNNRDEVKTTDRGQVPSRQSLHTLLEPKADN